MRESIQDFRARLTGVQRRRRWSVVLTCGGALLVGLVAAVAAIAAIDFRWELDQSIRQATVLITGTVLLLWGLRAAYRGIHRWSTAATAAEVERRHPEFGQRVRTTVQFSDHQGDELKREGVEPSLVAALARETDMNVLPGDMEEVVPMRPAAGLLGLGLAAIVVLAVSLQFGWDWKTAVARTLLSDRPFTTLAVEPGSTIVDEGASLPIRFTVMGRPRESVQVQSRLAMRADAEWAEETLDLSAATPQEEREWAYEVRLSRITEPMEYRVIAGPAASDTYRIDVRYPLEIVEVRSTLIPPEYTGLKPRDIADGNLTGLKGTEAEVEIVLDRVPSQAEAVLTRVGALPQDVERTWTVPVAVDGPSVRFALALEHDLIWSLKAAAGDGTVLPDNAFRVRVQPDQAPKVSFQEPDSELEVHTLAEILMRIRASDDYGLTRSGIVFQINNGEEHTLLEEHFTAVAEAAEELDSEDPLSMRTRVTLERLLPLEYFELTEKDSVMYYAFAEDNFPEQPQRAESEWRFVDIRPFRMRFRAPDPNMPGGDGAGGRRPLTSLEELIRRERYTLNRTVKLDRRDREWSDKELGTIDRLIDYQAEISSLTRELAERLSEFGVSEEVDVLFQAETSMLGAVDTLTVGDFASAVLQEKDAQQYLVEARNRLLVQLANNASLRRALNQFNQQMRQKLRRDRMDQELAASLVRRLQQLAANQGQTSAQALTLASSMTGGGAGTPAEAPASPVQTEDPSETSEESPPGGAAAAIDPEDLEERQYEAAAEAKELLDRLDEVNSLTELVRQRMEAATSLTDEAAMSFSRGNTREAGEQTARTAEQFEELARQVEALVAREYSERVAASRNIANRLAEQERNLAERLQGMSTDEAQPAEEMDKETSAAMAGRVREGARTLEDVLTALSRVTDPDAGEAPERVATIIEEQQLTETVSRAVNAAETVASEPTAAPPDKQADLADTAERFELTSADLDRLYRSMVMPRMARLRELERKLSEAQEELEPQETRQDIADFTEELAELIRDLEEAEAGGATREELFQMVEERQLPGADQWLADLAPNGVGYTAPESLRTKLAAAAEELRRQIHELILADLQADQDSPIPPEYEQLVNEYFRVIAADSEKF